MTQIRPYLIIPNLIAQPTWGGEYIAAYKNLHHQSLTGHKIGQSYELYEHTNLSTNLSSRTNPPFEIGDPDTPYQTTHFNDQHPISLEHLIRLDQVSVLGSKAIEIYGPKMGVLIKFTQAKGNSYQLHVKKDQAGWQTKPESWYYFEPGFLTLGVKPNIDWDKYQAVCWNLYNQSKQLSSRIKSEELNLNEAKTQMKTKIKESGIEDFVNFVTTTKDEAIDLSACGIHHSWEEDAQKFPLGNVLYEVQKNSFDPKSTIRNFDKGKFKPDGSIRQLQIQDYFKYIDRSPEANNPDNHRVKVGLIANQKGYSLKHIFNNHYYQLREIAFTGHLQNAYTRTADSFHHLFAKSGTFTIQTTAHTIEVSQGFSAFIPASTGQYQLTTDTSAVVLQTYV